MREWLRGRERERERERDRERERETERERDRERETDRERQTERERKRERCHTNNPPSSFKGHESLDEACTQEGSKHIPRGWRLWRRTLNMAPS